METKPDKQQTVTRLALCVVVAVALYAAAGKVPPLELYRNSGSNAAPMRPASLPRAARTSRVRWRLLRA